MLHLFGDFILQNDKMALNKKKTTLKGFFYCLLHCCLYALPFFLLTNWIGVILICITHFIIDRWDFVGWFNSKKNFIKTRENFGYNL